jgi:putative membrane protein
MTGSAVNRPDGNPGNPAQGSINGQGGPAAAHTKTNNAEEARMRKTTGVADRLFKAPNPAILIFPIIIVSFLIGYIALFNFSDTGSNLTGEKFYSAGLVFGLVMIGGPALLAGVVMTPTANALGGLFYTRRSILLAFASVLIIALIIIIAKLISAFIAIDFMLTLAMSYAWIMAFQLSILVAISNSSFIRSLPPAAVQPGFGLILIFFGYDYAIPGYSLGTDQIMIIVLFIIIFLVLTAVWVQVVTRPLRKTFGSNPLDMVKQGFAHFTEGEGAGTELEGFFENFGKTVETSASILAVRRKSISDSLKLKALVVVPDVHMGPFGYLGGSNMPEKLYKELKGLAEHTLVLHGTATHDLNPVSSSETSRMARAVVKSVEGLKKSQFSSKGSKLVRKHAESSVNVSLQYLGETPVSTYTASPKPTDDIDYRIGKKARSTIRSASKGSGDSGTEIEPLFVDAHNCMKPGEGYVHLDSPRTGAILKALKEVTGKAGRPRLTNGLEIGYAEQTGFTVDDHGLGPMGIQVLAVRTAEKEKTAYILFDGNNMIPGLRETIINHLKSKTGIADAEVLTSDNHVVNMTIGGYSPVGEKFDKTRLLKILVKLVEQAMADLEPGEAASAHVKLTNFKVFGQGNTMKLSSAINETVSLMGKSFAVCYGSAFALAIWAMFVIL